MAAIFDKHAIPTHVFNIPDLDFHEDLFADRLGSLWFRLGVWTIKSQRNDRGVEDVIERQSVMLTPGRFSEIYDKLESVGNVFHNLGEPVESVQRDGDYKKYAYAPFHRFELRFTSIVCEPLVSVRILNSGIELFINPDLELFFKLEEKTVGCGLWWDPRRGVEALRRRVIANSNLQIVEIRVDYLRKYLQARQVSLLVGHYRHLHLFDPSPSTLEAFVKEDIVRGSPDQGAKAIFQNWGLRQHNPEEQYLQRRLHLWFEIKPPESDIDDPWADEPSFDPYEFTLPTQGGPVAPGRWKHFRQAEGREFDGGACDFMDRVYFRQEVLSKYEGASGFDVLDNGSVSCRHYWGLVRSTSRIGNELLATAIGDFAEGVPFEEWPHWKQHAIEPPSVETINALYEEQTIPHAVNSLVGELDALNATFASFSDVMKAEISVPLWGGSLKSLAGRQLKWVYSTTADDDEFLKRATLMSTLVVDGLAAKSLRELLQAWDEGLHLNDGGQSLRSRKLLERVTFVAVLIEDFQPNSAEIPMLVKQAEGKANNAGDPDLQTELKSSYQKTREDLSPLAFLYDLRTHGGFAHSPNREKVATAAAKLRLPKRNWHRTDYLQLLGLVAGSVKQVSEHLETAAKM